jgi:hypothetical protein
VATRAVSAAVAEADADAGAGVEAVVEVAVADHPTILFSEPKANPPGCFALEILPAVFHAYSCFGQRHLPHSFTQRARKQSTLPFGYPTA